MAYWAIEPESMASDANKYASPKKMADRANLTHHKCKVFCLAACLLTLFAILILPFVHPGWQLSLTAVAVHGRRWLPVSR